MESPELHCQETEDGDAGETASVVVRGVSKRFGELAAVDEVTVSVRRGEFFSLLGPSGCGKTTLLRLIAGFEAPTGGAILLGGVDVTAVPAHRRPVHLVFQQYALFPHLTVADNVAFGLRYQGVPRAAQPARVAAALELVRLVGLAGRRPDQLSGGQRQRVALARALALEPQVLLLDEPLSALDRKLREEMQVELKALQRRLGITFLLVTHDQEEALAMSDRVAIMNRGRIEQVGAPAEVYERPVTAFVATFLGASNFWTGTVSAVADTTLTLRLPHGEEVSLPLPTGRRPAPGETLRFLVRPERLRLSRTPSSRGPSQPVRIAERIYQGASTLWIVEAGERAERYQVYAQNSGGAGELTALEPGSTAFLSWEPGSAVLLAG